MVLVPAECPECGGIVKVDNKERLAVCQYCGKPFVVEEAIQTFNNYYNNIYHITNNTNHNYGDGAVVNVYEDKSKDFVIEGGVLREYHGESLTPVVPEGVIAIEGGVFANSAITKVTLPSTLKELRSVDGREGPFSGCKYLKEINLPEGLNLIGDYCFYDCNSTTSIIIPNSVAHIGRFAFCGCTGITSITIPRNITYIGEYAFRECTNLEKVFWDAKKVPNFPSNGSPFSNAGISCSGFELVFGDNVEEVPAYCCQNSYNVTNNIKSVTFGVGVKSIGDCAFECCKNLISIVIPDSVTSIGQKSFIGCINLAVVTFGDGVTSIGSYAFSSCKNLSSVVIGKNVKNIGGWAFMDCSNLKTVTINNTQTNIGPAAFHETPYLRKSKGLCQYCGGCFNGLFTKKCGKCGKEKDY